MKSFKIDFFHLKSFQFIWSFPQTSVRCEVCVLPRKKKLRKNVTGWERRGVLGRGLNLWGGFLVLPPRRDGRTDRQWWVETQEEWTQRQRGAPKEVTAPPRAQAPSEHHTFRSLSFLPWETQILTGSVKWASLEQRHSTVPELWEYRATALLSASSQCMVVSDWGGTPFCVSLPR